jgi:hypothetical protein
MENWQIMAKEFDWEKHRQYLQRARFKPLFDRAFGELLAKDMGDAFKFDTELKQKFLAQFHLWVTSSNLNKISGLEDFPHRDFISGVTHYLDDLHITFGQRLVAMEQEYAYHTRMKADFPLRKLETLQRGDVLVFGAPFAWYGGLHPETQQILDRCLELDIPVHIDAAWFGCVRGFTFHYNHPAVQSVAFSLSKGLGLGSHRVGVRYSKNRHAGPVTIVNDFAMEVNCVMACGLKFMQKFGSDYLQNRYGGAYQLVCEKFELKPTMAIHTAFDQVENGNWEPVGIRPFLRYLVDDLNEFK